MVPFAGWEMPVQYAGIIEEHTAVRSSAGVFDVSHMAQFRVFGFGAFDYLQGLLTNDLNKISGIGEAQYTLMCDEDGGIIDDLIVYHSGDLEYLIIANAANRHTDLDWMRSHAPSDVAMVGETCEERDPSGVVELVDESDRTALIALQGPAAMGILAELAGEGFEPPARFSIGEARLDTVPTLIARTGYTGEDGVEILCHASNAAAVWRLLLSFPEVNPCGLGARDTLRLEMGYHLYGQDMDRGVDPVSAGLAWVVPRDKTGFVGFDAIASVRQAGPVRRLVGLTVDGAIPRPGMAVLRDGTEVGKVASGTFSPTLSTGIATAYVPAEFAEPGTEFSVAVRKKVAAAVVTKPPFVKQTSLSSKQS
jgi:aminomethyltransferase